jgi:lipoprotein-releasing system permease protein
LRPDLSAVTDRVAAGVARIWPRSGPPGPDGSVEPAPFSGYERMLAGRYLRARRREGFVSVIAGFSFAGIMLGVATLIVVLSVMNGFRKELINKILGVNGHMFVQALDTPLSDHADVARRLAAVKGVRAAIPLIEGQALLSSPFAASGALVRGVREADLPKLESVANSLRAGTIEGFDTGEGLVIGRRLADHLGVRVGDKVTLLAPTGAQTPFGVTPRRKTYTLAGVFEIGMSEFDQAFVFMPFAEAQIFFNKEDDASVIELFVDEPERIGELTPALREAAGRRVLLTDWRERNRTFFGVLEVERNMMFIIVSLVVLVAALNIVSGLVMLVKDKARDIAILRTMGASRNAMMRVFLMTGASIGIAGTLAGLLLGILIALNVESIRQAVSWLFNTQLFPPEFYFLSRLPAEIHMGEVLATVAMALTLSLLASVIPARRAARLDPVEALRYE